MIEYCICMLTNYEKYSYNQSQNIIKCTNIKKQTKNYACINIEQCLDLIWSSEIIKM